MVRREPTVEPVNRLVCRRCEYETDVLRPSCPECGGDMIYDASAE